MPGGAWQDDDARATAPHTMNTGPRENESVVE